MHGVRFQNENLHIIHENFHYVHTLSVSQNLIHGFGSTFMNVLTLCSAYMKHIYMHTQVRSRCWKSLLLNAIGKGCQWDTGQIAMKLNDLACHQRGIE